MSKKNVNPAETGKSAQPADRLFQLERRVISYLEAALVAVQDLSDAKREAKLSVSRLLGVSRELRELIKVMTLYGC